MNDKFKVCEYSVYFTVATTIFFKILNSRCIFIIHKCEVWLFIEFSTNKVMEKRRMVNFSLNLNIF
jgi:hypothetical protein